MNYDLQVVTAPSGEPLAPVELETHLGLPPGDEVETLYRAELIRAAREYAEDFLGRALITQTWAMFFDNFSWPVLRLPKPPLVSVTHIKYVDTAGVKTTWAAANYLVNAAADPGYIRPAYGVSWPSARLETIADAEMPRSCRVQFVCGYGGNADAVPARILQAMLLLIGEWNTNREAFSAAAIPDAIQKTVDAMLWPLRYFEY